MNTPKTVPHTLAPWHLIGSRDSGFTIHASLPDGTGDTDALAVCRNISRDTNEANAAHIVLCVNSHDRLVKACGAVINGANREVLIAAPHKRSEGQRIVAELRAALAAAQPT